MKKMKKIIKTVQLIVIIVILLTNTVGATANEFRLQKNKDNDPELYSNRGEPMFKFENNKLILIEKNKFPETQTLLDNFYNLPNKKLITTTEKYTSELLQDGGIYGYAKNKSIQFFLYAAVGEKLNWWDLKLSDLHKTHYIEICKLAGNPVKLDTEGSINSTEMLLRKLPKQANKISLYKLEQNTIFSDNWRDAINLQGKSVKITVKRTLTKEDKTILLMEQYREFKEYTSNIDIENMRNFLFRYLDNNASYMSEDRTTDEYVVTEYLKVMQKAENDFQNTILIPKKTLEDWDMTIDDL